jgi:nitrile hydratase
MRGGDEGFRARLLTGATELVRDLGYDLQGGSHRELPFLELRVVENSPAVHNVIVCTLCSCYPRMLLGIPPEWYKSRSYRSRMVREPRAVLAEFGLKVPDHVSIRVHDSTADMRYLVLPMRPPGTEGWSEERLAALVTRDSMIGTGLPLAPEAVR